MCLLLCGFYHFPWMCNSDLTWRFSSVMLFPACFRDVAFLNWIKDCVSRAVWEGWFPEPSGRLGLWGEIEFAAGLIPPCHTGILLESWILLEKHRVGWWLCQVCSHLLLSHQELCQGNNFKSLRVIVVFGKLGEELCGAVVGFTVFTVKFWG